MGYEGAPTAHGCVAHKERLNWCFSSSLSSSVGLPIQDDGVQPAPWGLITMPALFTRSLNFEFGPHQP